MRVEGGLVGMQQYVSRVVVCEVESTNSSVLLVLRYARYRGRVRTRAFSPASRSPRVKQRHAVDKGHQSHEVWETVDDLSI